MAKNRNKAAVNAPKPRAFGLVVVAALMAQVAVTAGDHAAHQCDRERVSSATSVH